MFQKDSKVNKVDTFTFFCTKMKNYILLKAQIYAYSNAISD